MPSPPVAIGVVVISIPVPLPALPPLPSFPSAFNTPTSLPLPAFPGGAPGGAGAQDFPPDGPVGIAFPSTPKATICGFGLPSPLVVKIAIPIPIINFPPKIPLPFLAIKLTCTLPNPVDVTSSLNMPFGGGRASNAGVDPDDFSEAA